MRVGPAALAALALALVLPACAAPERGLRVLPSDWACLAAYAGESAAQANLRRSIEHYAVTLDRRRTVEVIHRHGSRYDFTYRLADADTPAYPAGEDDALDLAKAIYRPFLVAEDATASERSWECEPGTWSFSGMEADWRITIARRNLAFPGNNATLYLDSRRSLAKVVVGL